MDDFNTETDSDYTSYWRDWVSNDFMFSRASNIPHFLVVPEWLPNGF
jgi:hypothetical protein